MPNAFAFDNAAPVARPLAVAAIPLPAKPEDLDASSNAYDPLGAGTAVTAAPAAMSNTPPDQIAT